MAKLEFSPDKVKADVEAEVNITQIVNNVASSPDGRFLLTRNGNPSVVIVNVDYIENLLGDKVTNPTLEEPVPHPFAPLAPPPDTSNFMPQSPIQPMPPLEVQEKPPLEPPVANDFQPLISPPFGSDVHQPPAGPMPGPSPFQAPMQPQNSLPAQGPGTPLPPPPPLPPISPTNTGPIQPESPYLGPQQ